MCIMIHLNNNKVASSAVYSIEDYNQEMANKTNSSNATNLLVGAIILFGMIGLYFSTIGA